MDKNVILVDEIMGAIDQTEEWQQTTGNNPEITGLLSGIFP